eukprot:2801153-Prymnesium_polylepis.1
MMSAAHPLCSFSNVKRLEATTPGEWQIVKGWSVFEMLDRPAGSVFVAVRHWWLASAEGVWIDPAGSARSLLVESVQGEKTEEPLSLDRRAAAFRWASRLRVDGVPQVAACAPAAAPVAFAAAATAPVPAPATSSPSTAAIGSAEAVRLVELSAVGEAPKMLSWQQTRDLAGGGVSTRSYAERKLAEVWDSPGGEALTRTKAKSQLLSAIDRALSDEPYCS